MLNPDAELLAACEVHPANLAAFNANGVDNDEEKDPLWREYCRTRDIITNAQPQTMAGILAKAQVTATEAATDTDGIEMNMTSMAGRWAWHLVNDLLALHGKLPVINH